MTYARYIVAGLLVAGLIIFGWKVNGWRLKAAEAHNLATALDFQIKRTKEVEEARVLASERLALMDQALAIEVREVIRYVPKYIRSDCTLDVDGVRALNRARGLSDTARGIAATAPAP